MSCLQHSARPLAVAHRAANHLHLLDEAKAAGADLAECDLWLHRGRLEVRHLKTMGPIPLLWDRWKLVPGWAPRLLLDDLLEAAGTGIHLMIDLKGREPGLPRALAEALGRHLPEAPYSVTTRNWHFLERFEGIPGVCLLPSAAYPDELAELMPELGTRFEAISLHRTLVTPENMAAFKERDVAVITWPINTREACDEVVAAGVAGINSDNLALVAEVVAERRQAASA